jgi:hypothetical protein
VIWLALVERLEHVEVVQTFLSFGNLRILSASLGASLGIVYHNDWRVALAGWLTVETVRHEVQFQMADVILM